MFERRRSPLIGSTRWDAPDADGLALELTARPHPRLVARRSTGRLKPGGVAQPMILDAQTVQQLEGVVLAPTEAYYTAVRALTQGTIAGSDMLVLARIAQRLSLAMTIQLARELDDWCPWVPLLVLVTRARAHLADDEDLRAAEANLRRVARSLLDAQGFRRVDVQDVLAHPPQLQSAIQAMVFGAATTTS